MYGRLPIVKMLAATVAMAAAISAVMLSINWDGQEASTAAAKIDDLLNVMIVISSFVFSLVVVALFYALWKFKAKPGDESDGEPIHGNTRLEVAWTVIPTIIVLFGGGYSWKVLDEIEKPAKDPLTVDVFSQQYAWSFGYPGKGDVWSQGVLHVPSTIIGRRNGLRTFQIGKAHARQFVVDAARKRQRQFALEHALHGYENGREQGKTGEA